MRYLENAIKFLLKYWILAVPLFVLTAIPALISGSGTAAAQMGKLWQTLSDPGQLTNPGNILSTFSAVLPAIAGGGILAFIFQFVSIPATYGLVNKGLETGNAGLNDVGQAISLNFVKYVMYFVGMIVLGIAVTVVFVIISLILGLLISILKGIGIIITVIVMLALVIALIVLAVLLSMWLSAMVVDGLDVIGAAKKSIEIVRTSFWMVLGIIILVAIACGIAGWILGLLAFIPLLGPIIASIVPTVQAFIMIVFLLSVYRERTGKANAA